MKGSCNFHTSKRDTLSAVSEYQGIYSILKQKCSACTGRADLMPDRKTFTICWLRGVFVAVAVRKDVVEPHLPQAGCYKV
jgi:hypothetical protein